MSLPKLPEKIYAYWAHEPELRSLGYVEGIVADEKNLAQLKTPGAMSKVGVYQLVEVITLPPAPTPEEL